MDPLDDKLVSIFRTDDPGVLPLATMALEGAGIEHWVKSAGKADTMHWTMSQRPTNRPLVQEIFVTPDVAARARDLVVDLEAPSVQSPADTALAIAEAVDPPTVRLEDAATGIALGAITEAQLQELSSHLEEDAPQQYFVNTSTIEMLRDAHADAALVALLRQAASGTGVTIRWVV